MEMGKVVAEVVIVPHGTASPSLGKYVAEVEKTLRSFGLKTMLTPMGTILEGDLDAVLEAVRAAHEIPFREGALRVGTTIRIDDRRDREVTMESKMRSVEEKIGK
ncbi:MAG: MTH1187 family thiamine-binding protein [Thermovirgaceae bacterium]|nr:MTH1187 family thiamine-binding protein [Thermovirgaceae bacterium]